MLGEHSFFPWKIFAFKCLCLLCNLALYILISDPIFKWIIKIDFIILIRIYGLLLISISPFKSYFIHLIIKHFMMDKFSSLSDYFLIDICNGLILISSVYLHASLLLTSSNNPQITSHHMQILYLSIF